MNAENIRDRYMALVADREAVFAFHSSIPAAQSDEETAERLRRCYARLSSLLEADSAKGDAKAQFVLGHLLTKGHEIYLQLRVTAEGRPSRSYRRGLDWLIRADRQGLSEATEELVEQWGMLLRVRTLRFRAWQRQVKESRWHPTTREAARWMAEARDRGYAAAALHLAIVARQVSDGCKDADCLQQDLLKVNEYLASWEAANPTLAKAAVVASADGFPLLGSDGPSVQFDRAAREEHQQAYGLWLRWAAPGQELELQDYAMLGRHLIDFEMIDRGPAALYAGLQALLFLQRNLDPENFRVVFVEYHRRMDSWAEVLAQGR